MVRFFSFFKLGFTIQFLSRDSSECEVTTQRNLVQSHASLISLSVDPITDDVCCSMFHDRPPKIFNPDTSDESDGHMIIDWLFGIQSTTKENRASIDGIIYYSGNFA